jgi:polygalacturonase
MEVSNLKIGLKIAAIVLLSSLALCAGPPFNVRDYGAKADGATLDTEAFRTAIQAAKKAGGGTVFVPAGHYVSGPIELVSNLILYFDAGAVVRFPAMRLPFTKGRQQSIEALTPVPLIGGHDLENVTVGGRGTLMSDNAEWMKLMPRQKSSSSDPGSANGPNWEHLLQVLETKTPASQEDYEKAAPELRPSFVRLMESKNVLIEGLHFVGSPMWTVHLLYTDNATVRDLIIETNPGVHTDGIAIDSSRNVRISNCYIDTGDDGIVIKAGKDADGLRVNRPTENVSITNCTVHHAHGAVTIGSETSGWVRNLVASNITCKDTQMGVRIKSRRGRGGGVEDVRFDNWTMEGVGQGINVTNFYIMEGEVRTGEQPVSKTTPVFRNIAVSNMTINGSRLPINIEGLPEMPIAGLRITDVIANSKTGMKAYNTTGLELHNVQINAETGPAFLVRDSKDAELDHVTSRKPLANAPVIRIDRSPGLIIRDSRAFSGTGAFLSVGSGELKSLILEGNVLGLAKRATQELKADFWKEAEPPTEGESASR